LNEEIKFKKQTKYSYQNSFGNPNRAFQTYRRIAREYGE